MAQISLMSSMSLVLLEEPIVLTTLNVHNQNQCHSGLGLGIWTQTCQYYSTIFNKQVQFLNSLIPFRGPGFWGQQRGDLVRLRGECHWYKSPLAFPEIIKLWRRTPNVNSDKWSDWSLVFVTLPRMCLPVLLLKGAVMLTEPASASSMLRMDPGSCHLSQYHNN